MMKRYRPTNLPLPIPTSAMTYEVKVAKSHDASDKTKRHRNTKIDRVV